METTIMASHKFKKLLNRCDTLTTFYCNPGGLTTKLELIRSNFFSQLIVPDIFIITETRFDQEIKNNNLGLSGYCIFRRDRNSTIRSRGGGVLIAIKREFQAELINNEHDGLEQLFLKLLQLKIIISVLYIPTPSDATPYVKHVNIVIIFILFSLF